MAAAANGQLDIVKLLLENGANIHHINEVSTYMYEWFRTDEPISIV